jgi:hypothetical protein
MHTQRWLGTDKIAIITIHILQEARIVSQGRT